METNLLSIFLVGLIVGAIARFLVSDSKRLGCIGTSVLGILGSFVGGTIFELIASNDFKLTPGGFWASVFGAVVLLVTAQLFSDSK